MSYFTRDPIEEICEAGRGHLIPDYDLDWYEQDELEDWREYICEEQEARIDAGDGADDE